ncbi:sugar ABC transporter ATP-binding protein [Nonomuraea sp. SYSU D8015]|uniref:sugar ABC transporter ATP-binding protein n=1 Tax=Nonomuraea sp. SYSU D8015 TaxID=2593644 RepID=UPI001CB6D46B|nr:sugar ABC transporter ATP-binding protein [Nonomuraea sp. SYSU D8015]
MHDDIHPAGPGSATVPDPLVRIRGLRKHFGGTHALRGVDLDLHGGSILALLGANGAGKSTLIKILAGIHHADEGEISVAAAPLGGHAATGGMAFIHQDLGLVEWMSVAENIALGAGYPRRGGLISWRAVRRRGADALDTVACRLDPDTPIARLTRAERSLVAIARALATDARILVFDEPTASLPAADCAVLFDVLRTLRDRGHAILYVTHRIDEVYRIADSVAVLRDGRLVSRGPLAGRRPADLVRDIVGRETRVHRRRVRRPGKVLLRLSGVRTGQAGPVGFALRRGEMLGLVGLAGAGHVDVGRALAGASPVLSGRVVLAGRPYRPASVAAAVGAGIGLLPSNRAEEAAAQDLSVRENLLANPAARGRSPLSATGPGRERAETAAVVTALQVRPADPEAPFAALSGGNQQKVLIGRWLGAGRRLLILEEPTAGVDVGAKSEIHRLLGEALATGLAVLLVSGDFEEVVNMCDRALVFARGAVTAELSGGGLTVAALTHAATATPVSRRADRC